MLAGRQISHLFVTDCIAPASDEKSKSPHPAGSQSAQGMGGVCSSCSSVPNTNSRGVGGGSGGGAGGGVKNFPRFGGVSF